MEGWRVERWRGGVEGWRVERWRDGGMEGWRDGGMEGGEEVKSGRRQMKKDG